MSDEKIYRTENLRKFKENFLFIALSAVVYAIVYTFCLYENPNGITSILYSIITLVYLYLVLKKLDISIDKSVLFHGTGIILLGINLCTTTDFCLVFLDHVGILLLTGAGLLHIFCDDSKWGMGKYASSIVTMFITAIGHGFIIIEDFIDFIKKVTNDKENKKSAVAGYIIIGAMCAVPLLAIVTILLVSADKFFGDFVSNIFETIFDFIKFDNVGVIFMFFVAFLMAFGSVRTLCDKTISDEVIENNKINAIIAITVNFMIGFVYLIFSGFQIFYLFLGNMTLPEDYSFAEYAREGFFQLVVVCLINMVIVLLCLYLFQDNKVLKASLILISACTYIMIASSTMRMIMYVSAYQLTYTRVFVFVALVVIFMIMNGILIFIFNKDFPLFRYSMIVVSLCYLIFAYSKPCNYIAANNLSKRFCQSTEEGYKYTDIDFTYINNHLGTDAVVAVDNAISREHDRNFERFLEDYYDNNQVDYTYRTFNFSKLRFNNSKYNR